MYADDRVDPTAGTSENKRELQFPEDGGFVEPLDDTVVVSSSGRVSVRTLTRR